MARLTGLEPATPGVTGRYSNRLSYNRAMAVCYRTDPGASRGELTADDGMLKRLMAPARPARIAAVRSPLKRQKPPHGGGFWKSGAVDGARTRDPRRDRPVL